jgi:hypothetical protein
VTITKTTCITEVPESVVFTETETIVPKDETEPVDITITGVTEVTPTVEIDSFSYVTIPSWTNHPITEQSISSFVVTPEVDVVSYTETVTTPNG